MEYSPVRDVRNVTVTTGWEKRHLGVVTLVPDEDYPEDLGARWTVRKDGETLGNVSSRMHRPVRQSRPSDLKRGHRVDLAPRKVWDADRADGTHRRRLTTRNEALAFLLNH